MTVKEAYQQLLLQLYTLYDDREAANIADLVIEHVTGQRKIDRIIFKTLAVDELQQKVLENISSQLLSHVPVQYVLKEAWFYGMKFYVDRNVLIPRPETEELIEWVIEEIRNTKYEIQNVELLDIGTGSGCIPISLKKKLSSANISSVDISEAAIAVAKKNAVALNAEINFIDLDFLDENNWKDLSVYDIIVSNPPYIKQSEQVNMSQHVISQEPHLALFVADDDALLFYKKIALFGKKHLNPNGKIFVEINEKAGKETEDVFIQMEYQIVLKKDLQGKDRMLMAELKTT